MRADPEKLAAALAVIDERARRRKPEPGIAEYDRAVMRWMLTQDPRRLAK